MRKTGTFVIGGLFVLTILLVLLGVITVLSASQFLYSRNADYNVYTYMGRQLIYLSFGLAGMSFFALYDYNQWESKARILLLFSIILLGLVLTPMGVEVNGAQRWLRFGKFSLQPSDLMKLTTIMYLSAFWADRRDEMGAFFRSVLFPMVFVGIGLAMIVLEPDHGTTVFIGMVAMVIWFTAGGRQRHLVPVGILFTAAIIMALYQKPHLFERISAYLHPEQYPKLTYQVNQAVRGISYGGMWGVGLGEGMQQLGFIPEVHTDFIFATMGEELGFVKCSLVLSMYLMLTVFGYWIAIRCGNPFGQLLAVGCTTAIGFQAALNIAVVTGSIPTTGISLPFISYGGSSLTIFMSMVGLLINIARDAFMTDRPARAVA